MRRKFLCILVLLLAGTVGSRAQTSWALKTNLLHDATASVNLALEYAFAPKWSVELSGSYNGWNVADMRWRHWIVQPEARYWFCERFSGGFVAAHVLGGQATLGSFWDFSQYGPKFPNLKTFLLNNALVLGVGAGIGYDLVLGRHWNVEFELGVGYMYVTGDEYELVKAADGTHYLPAGAQPVLAGSIFDYLGPTKLAVSIVYLF